jgi:hypothetical protein
MRICHMRICIFICHMHLRRTDSSAPPELRTPRTTSTAAVELLLRHCGGAHFAGGALLPVPVKSNKQQQNDTERVSVMVMKQKKPRRILSLS